MGIVRNLTRFKKLQDEVIRQDKITAIGKWAAGIAHDFNNILSIILGNISLARMFSDERCTEYKKFLSYAEEGVAKARGLTNQLLTFSDTGEPQIQKCSIRKILTEAIQFGLSGSNIASDISIPQDIWKVFIDSGQIGQAVTNLVLNAKQSMPYGGRLIIRVENADINQTDMPSLKSGKYLKISFKDTGKGIPEHLLKRVFEPFFSVISGGQGIGLSIVYGILKKHQGEITITSEVDKGSVFSLYIPATGDIDVPDNQIAVAELPKHILILDDIRNVGDILETILGQYCSADIVTCTESLDAIEKFSQAIEDKNPFDLVFLDMTLPGGMGGEEVLRKIQEYDPDVQAIAMSAYTEKDVIRNPRKYGFYASIRKPFDFKDVVHAIESISTK